MGGLTFQLINKIDPIESDFLLSIPQDCHRIRFFAWVHQNNISLSIKFKVPKARLKIIEKSSPNDLSFDLFQLLFNCIKPWNKVIFQCYDVDIWPFKLRLSNVSKSYFLTGKFLDIFTIRIEAKCNNIIFPDWLHHKILVFVWGNLSLRNWAN